MIADKVGRYRIVRPLGAGGMGEVYLAEDPNLQRQVALKILSNADGKLKRRFVREAILASKLSHPNVAVVHEAGETDDGTAFIAMQYVEGETLRDRLLRGPIPLNGVIQIAREVADALDDAHRHGVVHRDIKPGNIMIDSRGHAKVLDFGIAKLEELDALATPDGLTAVADTTAGKFVGTLQYVSPEQASGGAVDGRSDIFSLGIVVYEMITGKNPFAASTFLETVRRIRELTPPPIEGPPELKRVVAKCLEKNRERRYQNARDLVLDLESVGRASASRGSDRLKPVLTLSIAVLLAIVVAAFLLRRPPAAVARSAKIDSIAVLPFVIFSPDQKNEYIGDGITEEVINALAQLNGLKVVSRTSAFAFKGSRSDIREIGKSLGVDAVVEGSVQRANDRLRVTAQLINAHDGYHLWSETYNGAVADVFSIEDQIARSVAKALQRTMGRGAAAPATHDITAYELYLKARREESVLTREHFDNAIATYRAAIDREPSFAEAYAGLAETYSLMDHRPGLTSLPPKETHALAIEAANKSLSLDPDSVEAHTAIGHIDLHLGKFEEAQAHLNRALQLNPSFSYAHLWHAVLLRTLGRDSEARAEAQRAEQLDPLSPFIPLFWSTNALLMGDYETAIQVARHGIEVDPQNGELYANLGRAYALSGRFREAENTLQQAEAFGASNIEPTRAFILALEGRREEAMALLRKSEARPERISGPFMFRAWAAAGDTDNAMRWVNRSIEEDPDYARISIDLPKYPAFANLRSDARYLEARRKLGLPPL